MPVADFQQLIIAPCIDNDTLQTNFDSLNALNDEMNAGTVDVTCDPIDSSLGGRNTTGEECAVLFAKLPVNPLTAGTQKCVFLLTAKFTAEVVGQSGIIPFFQFSFNYSIKCAGVTVHQGNALANQTFSTFFQTDCPVGSEIEVCAEYAGVALSTTIDWTLDLCGGRLCIAPRDIVRAGASVPCTVKPDGKYGFDALSLMVQSLNALGSAFQFGGKTVRCVSIGAIDNESVAVSSSMASNTTYVVLGMNRVCFDPGTPDDINVIVQPVIGCESSQANCITGVARPQSVVGGLDKTCFRFPIATCGQCLAGESLYVGQNPELQCNEISEPQAGTLGYQVESEYCVWLFEDQTNDSISVPYPPRCITTNYLVKLRDAGDEIHTNVCNRAIPNCTIRCRDWTVEDLPLGPQPPLLIQEAVEWIPPEDEPDATAPPKKWYIVGSAFICHERSDTGLEDTQIGQAGYQILCGGVPYTSPTGIPFSDECEWTMTSSGSSNFCSPDINIVGIVECPIDQDIEIQFTADSYGFGFFNGPWTTRAEVKALCF